MFVDFFIGLIDQVRYSQDVRRKAAAYAEQFEAFVTHPDEHSEIKRLGRYLATERELTGYDVILRTKWFAKAQSFTPPERLYRAQRGE